MTCLPLACSGVLVRATSRLLNRVFVLGGIMKKACSACGQEKDIAKFSYKNKAKDIRKYACKACYNTRRKKYKKRNYAIIFEYLQAHPCVGCGNTDVTVLQFHHVTEKEENVSVSVCSGFSPERILEEIKKCVILCPNCHRKETARLAGGHPFERYGWI